MIISALLFAAPALAQDLELPVLSPRATVSQMVGTVKVSVDYSSPAKRDREIFGGLLPFGELWRAGANRATNLEVSGDVTIGGKDVPAGTYSVFAEPGEKEWTVILNTDAGASMGSYDKASDQMRFTVTPVEGPGRERLTYLFVDTKNDATTLHLEWAGVAVAMPIKVDSKGRGEAAVERFVSRAARGFVDAAKFTAEHGDTDAALAMIDKAAAIDNTWYVTWSKAELLSKAGDAKNAYKTAKLAMEMGSKAENFFYEDRVKKALAEWPKK